MSSQLVRPPSPLNSTSEYYYPTSPPFSQFAFSPSVLPTTTVPVFSNSQKMGTETKPHNSLPQPQPIDKNLNNYPLDIEPKEETDSEYPRAKKSSQMSK